MTDFKRDEPGVVNRAAGPGVNAESRERRFVLAGLMLALTLASLDQNIVATALPRITSELGGLAHLSWVVTAFVMTSTITTPLYGRLSDLYGRKPAFTVSISVFLIGSTFCGIADSMTALIVSRALQGLGAGGLLVLAQTVMGELVSPRERGRYQGLFAAVFAICSVAGPLLGGFLTQYASWRWIFYVNLPVGALALAAVLVWLRPRPARAAAPLDVAGAVSLTCGTSCLLLLLSWGGSTYPWFSPPIVGLAVVAAVAFATLSRVERRAAEPIMPPALFRNRIFDIAICVIALATMALFAAAIFLPLMFQLLIGLSPSRAGLMVSPMMGGVIVASVAGGRLVSWTGRYKPLPVLGLSVATASYAALALVTHDSSRLPLLEAILVFIGLGIGLVMPNLTTAIQNAVDPAELGAATATAAFFRSLGGALGVAAAGALLTTRLHALPKNLRSSGILPAAVGGFSPGEHAALVGAYRNGLTSVFAAGALIAVLAFAVVLFLPERPLATYPSREKRSE